MRLLNTETLLMVLCGLVVLSYLFSIISRYIRVPSVLLLLFAGLWFRALSDYYNVTFTLPDNLVESLGVVGLIMIVLEAGLDLELSKKKLPLIRNSFFSAILTLLVSAVLITFILYQWLGEDLKSCIVYALPLSIMSSSIVLPSIHHLTESKKEFLIYEASFSDIIGIILFNYFTAGEILTARSFGLFGMNIVIAVVLSLVLSYLLFLILARTKMDIKFFLIFSLLVLIYSGGKLLHLPSLLIILVFGLMIKNWEKIPLPGLIKRFPLHLVAPLRSTLHSITAETSFLVRTFFFILFGYTIELQLINNGEVFLIGSLIVGSLFLVRLAYLKYSFKTKIFPEVFFIPRGLITIVLFYKIPASLKLSTFNDGILFFVVLSTGVILSLGMIFNKSGNREIIEEPQFSERKDIL